MFIAHLNVFMCSLTVNTWDAIMALAILSFDATVTGLGASAKLSPVGPSRAWFRVARA